MLENNNVIIAGEVIKLGDTFKSYGKLFYSATVLVTTSEKNDDYIRIVYRKSHTNQNIKKGDSVYVKGSIKSYHNGLYIYCERIDKEDGLVPLNEISIHGIINREPSLRMTKSGNKICKFMLKSENEYGDICFVPIISWDGNAVYLSTYPVGTEVGLKGKVVSRDYFMTDADGYTEVKRTVLEVSITSFRVVESEE